ncbi:unnamed protein product [Schistocephalus solidus]|uniref:AAA+ ATPase domain-containing protein n=1 Tax=Schistocephalus solidus TaxID=70667 RepID=A0A3P7CA65_SCHSO|nr:unnamed protein product [Schistocephalus solidus]
MPSGVFWFIFFSSGFTAALAFYIYRVTKPIEVSWRVFSELLARGEVRNIQISQTRSQASVLLHSAQHIDGKIVFVINVPFKETALDFEAKIRALEDRLRISNVEKIPIIVTHDSSMSDFTLPVIISSAVLASLAYMWLRRNPKGLPSQFPAEEAIRAAFGLRQSHTGGQPTKPKQQQQQQQPQPPPSPSSPRRDGPTLGGNYTGGFGSGLPFMDAVPGLTEITPTTTDVTFEDVAGMHASKEEVMEFVHYLRDPAKYQTLGAKLPKGALLLGPPGTGKTLLVKALAHEANVPFFSMAGSEFIEVIGGLGASRIRKLFKAARQRSPSIIFIDEIDSVGRRRSADGAQQQGGGGSEMEQTLNQLLVEMDGMDTTEGTIVFAATNRADLLDKALLRAGRFDRHIYVDLPNLAERKELLDMYLGKYKLTAGLNKTTLRNRLATWTPGMSGADIARLCNEAALIAARRPNIEEGVKDVDFDAALERVIAGAARRSNPLSLMERRIAAVQEAGRALVAALLPKTGLTPFRISIIPRAQSGEPGESLGFTQFIPEEKWLMRADDIADRMAVLLAGRAAEQLVFNVISDASQRYLEKATRLAYKEVREWGMSEAVGNISFSEQSTNQFGVQPFSKRTGALIDSEVSRVIAAASQRAMKLIQKNESKLMRLVDLLLKNESVSAAELKAILEGEESPPAPSAPDLKPAAVRA